MSKIRINSEAGYFSGGMKISYKDVSKVDEDINTPIIQ